ATRYLPGGRPTARNNDLLGGYIFDREGSMAESGASAQACSGRCGCSDAALNSFCAALSADSRSVFCQAAYGMDYNDGHFRCALTEVRGIEGGLHEVLC
ncbi:MAG: hypothetical protein RR842_12635, partial [Gordonibacter sp.]|uniref:hypothetical protein n=1 Tax=Gordonibacter sp. TaxID=1968902 RepID=UPI002FC6CFB3